MIIEIRELKLYCRHGVFEQERAVGAWYTVTAIMEVPDIAEPAADDLDATVNYAEAIELIKIVMSRPVRLIETAAEAIKSALIDHFPKIRAVTVRVAKQLPPVSGVELAEVAVTVASDSHQSSNTLK